MIKYYKDIYSCTVIPGFSVLEIHDRNFCSLLDMYMFKNGASSSTRGGVGWLLHLFTIHWLLICCWSSPAHFFSTESHGTRDHIFLSDGYGRIQRCPLARCQHSAFSQQPATVHLLLCVYLLLQSRNSASVETCLATAASTGFESSCHDTINKQVSEGRAVLVNNTTLWGCRGAWIQKHAL
jgi:hypothetical protein